MSWQTIRDAGDTLFVPDAHWPHCDLKAFAVTLEFAKYLKPKRVVILGDWFDFYQLSRFDKDPARLLRLQEDLDEGIGALDDLLAACPGAEFHFVEGNHERRLWKWLCKNPELAGLRGLDPKELLGLSERRIKFWPEGTTLELGGLVVTHGSLISQDAGMSARRELKKWGTSGISGHTHRLAAYHESNYGGDRVWYEAGCLCGLDPSYVIGRPNWQHGLAIGDFLPGDERFTVHLIRIDRQYRIWHHGKLMK